MHGKFSKRLREFLRNESGSAGAEFVVSLPLLIGVMVIASEYGNALQIRDALDAATRDVTRFLARAPLNAAGDDFDSHFKTEATNMIQERLGGGATVLEVRPQLQEAAGTSGQFRQDYYVVSLRTVVYVDMSLLSLLDLGRSASVQDVDYQEAGAGKPGLTVTRASGEQDATTTGIPMYALDTTRYDGPGPLIDNITCTWVMQYQGTC